MLFSVAGGGCAEPHFADTQTDGAAPWEAGLDGQLLHDATLDAAWLEAAASDSGAGDAEVAWWPCTDNAAVLGAECPLVVHCPSIGPCDVRGNLCCVTQTTASCSARPSCGPAEQSVRCDGPEDCPTGQLCCHQEGSVRCVAKDACAEPDRLCHTRLDCDQNTCEDGLPGTFLGIIGVTYFKGGGLCRGT